MAAMKFLALRNPNERWLIDLILLFIPSTAPLESRALVQARTPSRCERSMRTNFLKGSSFERMAEFIHLRRCCSARHGCLWTQNSWKDSFRYQARTSGAFQRTNVESRSFCPSFRFHGFFSSNQRVPLKVTLCLEVSWRHSSRRAASTASWRCLTVWNRSNRICALTAYSRTRLAYGAHMSMHTTRSVW